jgi:hypothetical protein
MSRGAALSIKPEKEFPGLHPEPEIISDSKTLWMTVQDVRNGTLYRDW